MHFIRQRICVLLKDQCFTVCYIVHAHIKVHRTVAINNVRSIFFHFHKRHNNRRSFVEFGLTDPLVFFLSAVTIYMDYNINTIVNFTSFQTFRLNL